MNSENWSVFKRAAKTVEDFLQGRQRLEGILSYVKDRRKFLSYGKDCRVF